MPRSAQLPQHDPGPATQRIATLDILRGIAILGLVPVNIQVFAMVSSAIGNPPTGGVLEGAEGVAWIITHIVFEQKFEAILTMVFGASLVLLTQRWRQSVRRSQRDADDAAPVTALPRLSPEAALHAKRAVGLVVIGLLTYVLMAPRAWLVALAVSGWAACAFVDWRADALVRVGLLSIAFGAVLLLAYGAWVANLPETAYDDLVGTYWVLTPEASAQELAHLRGWWLNQISWRLQRIGDIRNFLLFVQTFWRLFGLMLIGMALLKWGVLSAKLATSRYAMGALAGIFVGLPIVTMGILENVAHYWGMAYTLAVGAQFNYWGSLVMAGGYVSLVLLVCRYDVLRRVKAAAAAVGRMSLSNYLLQLALCGWIFYGHGFGLIAQLGRPQQLEIAAALTIFQLIASPFWLRAFRFGPIEWLWRTFYYGRSIQLLYVTTAARTRP